MLAALYYPVLLHQCFLFFKHNLLALAICEKEGYTVSEEAFEAEAAAAAAGSGHEDTESYLESMGGDLYLYLQLYYQHALDIVFESAVGK